MCLSFCLPHVPLAKAGHMAILYFKEKNQTPPLVRKNGKVTIKRVYIKMAGIIVAISANNPPHFALWPQNKL